MMSKLVKINLLLCFLYAIPVVAVASKSVNVAQFSSQLEDRYQKYLSERPYKEELITVVIESIYPEYDINAIKRSGADLRYKFSKRHEVIIPAKNLSELKKNLHPTSFVRLPYPHKPLSIITEGAEISGALDMHALNNKGAGVRIGIIDLGFSSYVNSQNAGELPSNLVITDYTGAGPGGGNHGTNVAEIVHDMAPEAELYLARVNTIQQLQQATYDMQAAGVRIINHSVAWFGSSFYDGTGDLCDFIDNANSNGMQWVNAMGNSRNAHYLAEFNDADSDLLHEFGPGINYNTINLTSGREVTLVLNWDDYPVSRIDYDLYLYNGEPSNGGVIVASSQNSQGGPGNIPYEGITYTPAASGIHYIVVRRKSTKTPLIRFTLFSLGPSLGVKVAASSLTQPADCATVISVAAVDMNDNPESFSSEGPTTNGINKPDISATDRTQTSLSSGFAGTSGSSPHVAGALALLLSQNLSLTPIQLRDSLISTAEDVSKSGYDYRTGYGRISIDADLDLVNHDNDNCPLVANTGQIDTDSDSLGNACDTDDDNDGLSDAFEININSDPLLVDSDGDGLNDYYEVSYDGDSTMYLPGLDLNPLSADTDVDGIKDGDDPLPINYNYMDGDLAPLGNPDGEINIADYVIARRIISGDISVTNLELSHGDVYPHSQPDGEITTSDLLLIYKNILQ